MNKKTLNTLLVGAVAAASLVAGVTASHAEDAVAEAEKCFGVVKAGMNGCAAADGSHSCAGHATEDASGVEWISLPAGVCDKLAGGSLEPVTGEAAE